MKTDAQKIKRIKNILILYESKKEQLKGTLQQLTVQIQKKQQQLDRMKQYTQEYKTRISINAIFAVPRFLNYQHFLNKLLLLAAEEQHYLDQLLEEQQRCLTEYQQLTQKIEGLETWRSQLKAANAAMLTKQEDQMNLEIITTRTLINAREHP